MMGNFEMKYKWNEKTSDDVGGRHVIHAVTAKVIHQLSLNVTTNMNCHSLLFYYCDTIVV